MRRQARNLLYDRLHKGGVLVCLGLTIYGALILTNHGYNYFRYVRPKSLAAKLAAEQELLSEGSSEVLKQ